jgi:hypothetical protein
MERSSLSLDKIALNLERALLKGLKDSSFFDPHSSLKQSNVLFATLTYDVKRSSVRDAWEIVGEEFNNWARNLRKKFGRISHLRCWEVSNRGYPHVHLLMLFHDYTFRVIRIKGKDRIAEKEAFEKSYHSFVDVQAVRKVREGIRYITKYLSKTRSKSAVQSQTLTLALCWLFRKRSFAVSDDFHELILAIIKTKMRLIKTDLFSNKIDRRVKWVFIGIFLASTLGIKHNRWRKVITDRKILYEILQ